MPTPVSPLGFSIVAGLTAVHCFFVISGFYMAMLSAKAPSRAASRQIAIRLKRKSSAGDCFDAGA